jgi:hypothetical protein
MRWWCRRRAGRQPTRRCSEYGRGVPLQEEPVPNTAVLGRGRAASEEEEEVAGISTDPHTTHGLPCAGARAGRQGDALHRRVRVRRIPPGGRLRSEADRVLVDFVTECHRNGSILDAVDPRLEGKYDKEEVALVLAEPGHGVFAPLAQCDRGPPCGRLFCTWTPISRFLMCHRASRATYGMTMALMHIQGFDLYAAMSGGRMRPCPVEVHPRLLFSRSGDDMVVDVSSPFLLKFSFLVSNLDLCCSCSVLY